MDHRQLLKTYLLHVARSEGTNFLDYPGITGEERAELNDLYDEALEENT